MMQQIDWAEVRRYAKCGESPPEWPDDVQGISNKGLSLLGIDSQNRLYWDGKRVPTVMLTGWQKAGAFFITVSAVVAALAAVVSAYADVANIGN